MARRNVAVVGSGISGLVAAHALARTARITLFEADDRLGGHADTHLVSTPAGEIAIDTGFIVHNERTYPIVTALFADLGVQTRESDMSMSVSDEATGVEYAGALGLRGVFASRRTGTNPRHWWMLAEIGRFHRRARALLARAPDGDDEQTLGRFLDEGGFSEHFRRHFMVPLVGCVWSCEPQVALDYPARYLFTFLDHHGMLTVFGSPSWRTVVGGSKEYVRRIAVGLDEVRVATKVVDVAETADGVRITDGDGAEHTFDAAVLATHPDQALAMLAEPTSAQREVLGSFRYSHNLAQLHTDTSLLPRSPAARASWNHQRRADGRAVVTYDLSRLMRLPGHDDPTTRRHLVTLNGSDLIDPASVIATREYAHPVYDPASVAAQARLDDIDTGRIAFAGAYHGWGFHEDGARAGLHAARRLGANPPDPSAPRTPVRYRTTIKHARKGPVANAFSYRSRTWLVDLDHLPARGFEARDHLGDPSLTLRANLDAYLGDHGIERPARIRMLAHPRSLGHVFNPISVFWCDDMSGHRLAVVIEVHNTYGGRHAYLVRPDADGRAEVDKELYVSPFNDTSGHYTVAVPEPGERVRVAVTLHQPGRPAFVATLNGTAEPGARLRPSLSTHLVAWRIRRQGIRLWLRGLKIHPRKEQR